MNLKSNRFVIALTLALGMLFSTNAVAQSSCCSSEKHDETTCAIDHKKGGGSQHVGLLLKLLRQHQAVHPLVAAVQKLSLVRLK